MLRACLAGVALTMVLAQAAPGGDATAILAAARVALGGDATLSSITSLTARGSIIQTTPGIPSSSSSLEITIELPDKFLEVRRRSISRGPVGSFEMTVYEGVNVAEPIHAIVAPDAPMPVFMPTEPRPTTSPEMAAAKERQANGFKRRFARLSVTLLAASLAGYPVTFAGAAPTATTDVIEVTGADGGQFIMHVDRATHLPSRISWKDRPVVTFSQSSTVTARRGGMSSDSRAPNPPKGDPTAGMPDAAWETTIGAYRTENGITWPPRFTTTVNGKPHEERRIDRYRLNPKIDPRAFTPK